MKTELKTAIVHEWFVNYMGSEKCVESFVNIWNDADIFCLVDFLNDKDRDTILKGKRTVTSLIQNLPFSERYFRSYLPLFPYAVEQLDISGYDVIVSSSHSVAKGVLTNANQLHICYCHSPIRYAWDLYHQYMKSVGSGIFSVVPKYFLHKIRMWDFTTANRVDYFLANSHHIRKRIKKVYNRDADVIYPPVDIEKFGLFSNKEDFYLTVARFVPYKKTDLIVKAFTKLKDRKLIVIGNGPDYEAMKKIATPNIEFLGHQPFEQLKYYMQRAKAFIYAAEEDFGITVVEAQSCGTPVIAYKVGGTGETVDHGKTGVLFNNQTPDDILEAVLQFEKFEKQFDPDYIYKSTLSYSRSQFESRISSYVNSKSKEFFNS